MTRTRDRIGHSGAGATWLARAAAFALAAATLTVSLGIVTGAEAARLQPRTTGQTSTLAVIKTISVGVQPVGVAVNDEDDTIYVTNYGGSSVSVINGRTGTASGSAITVGTSPWGVAVDQNDDTVYVANSGSNDVSVINGSTGTVSGSPITVNNSPRGVAVDQDDDTVYVTVYSASNNVSMISGRTGTVTITDAVDYPDGVAVNQGDDTFYVVNTTFNLLTMFDGRTGQAIFPLIYVPIGSQGVAVDQLDDTVYVTNTASNSVSVINGRTSAAASTIAVGSGPFGIAVDQSDDTVYVANSTSNNVSVINGRTGQRTDDTITVGTSPRGVAVDDSGTNAGLAYVANYGSNNVSVIGRVTPSLVSTSGSAGSTAIMNLDVPQAAYDVDDSTITSVSFGGTPATGLTAGTGDTWTVTVPAGAGTVPVTVTFNGGRSASAGDFTYGAPTPTPPPAPTPAIVPAAQVLSGQVGVPVNPTSTFTLENFTLIPRYVMYPPLPPGLVLNPSTGVVTGTPTVMHPSTRHWITATAGGNAESAYSTLQVSVTDGPTPTPTPSITISGSRDGQRIVVSGTSTELAGKTLRPWTRFPGQTTFTQGAALITPEADGTFTWSRKTGKMTYVYIAHEATKSNTVTIPDR